MTQDDYAAFCEVVVGFAEIRGKQLSKAALKLYWQVMQPWQLDEFRKAAEHLLRTSEFMPTPKHFEDLRKAGEPTDAEAWAVALTACVNWRNAEMLPTGRIARAAATVGGFRAIAMADESRDLPFVQKRFLDAYNDLGDVEPVREALPQIAAYGGPRALSGPANIGGFIPQVLQRAPEQPAVVAALPAPVTSAPKAKPSPTKTAHEKIIALLPLQMTDEAIAKVSGQAIEIVRQVRAEQERAA